MIDSQKHIVKIVKVNFESRLNKYSPGLPTSRAVFLEGGLGGCWWVNNTDVKLSPFFSRHLIEAVHRIPYEPLKYCYICIIYFI